MKNVKVDAKARRTMSKKSRAREKLTARQVVRMVKESNKRKDRYSKELFDLQMVLKKELEKVYKAARRSLEAKCPPNADVRYRARTLKNLKEIHSWSGSLAEPILELLRTVVVYKMFEGREMAVTVPLPIIAPLPAEDMQVVLAAAVDKAINALRNEHYKCKFSRTCEKWYDDTKKHNNGYDGIANLTGWTRIRFEDECLGILLEKTRQTQNLHPKGNISIRISIDPSKLN